MCALYVSVRVRVCIVNTLYGKTGWWLFLPPLNMLPDHEHDLNNVGLEVAKQKMSAVCSLGSPTKPFEHD